MAIILIKICDSHMQAHEEEVPGLTIPPVTLTDGKQKVLDLCEDCLKSITYGLLLDLAELVGRDTDAEDPRASKATNSRQPIPEELRSQCRFCDRNDFKMQGRKMHERRTHTAELEALEAQEEALASYQPGDIVADHAEFYCEPCDRQFTSASGLNGHRTSLAHKELVSA